MKTLVTGGTGFVGSHIVRQLLDAGHEVRVLHRASSRLDALAGLDFESALGDVTDAASLRAACAGCDWVFHVAAVADYWRSAPDKLYHVNVEGTRNVLNAAREAGVQRVMFTSSAAAIGLRDDGQPADESQPFNLPPERFPYGHSKAEAEAVVREAVAIGQDAVILNPVVIIGPGDLNAISGTFVLQTQRLQGLMPITSGGIAVIDVRDVARAHLVAAAKGRTGERYILSAANISNRLWFEMIAEALDVVAPRLRTPDWLLSPTARLADGLQRLGVTLPVDANQIRLGANHIYFDPAKAHAELGPPQVSIADSLRDTVAWYRERGYLNEQGLRAGLKRMGRFFGGQG